MYNISLVSFKFNKSILTRSNTRNTIASQSTQREDSFSRKKKKKKEKKKDREHERVSSNTANIPIIHARARNEFKRPWKLHERERGRERERERRCRDAARHSWDLITLRSGINFHANSAWTLPWNLVAGLKTRPPGSIQLLAYDSRGNNLRSVRVYPATWDIGRYRFARKSSRCVWLLRGRRTRALTRVSFSCLLAGEPCSPTPRLSCPLIPEATRKTGTTPAAPTSPQPGDGKFTTSRHHRERDYIS